MPLGTSLTAGGELEFENELVPGPKVDVVILATGYAYDFPFLDIDDKIGINMHWERFLPPSQQTQISVYPNPHSFNYIRYVSPLYRHMLHAKTPTLAFIGIPLSIPCPIPFFEAQTTYLAEQWARDGGLSTEEERVAWVEERDQLVGAR